MSDFKRDLRAHLSDLRISEAELENVVCEIAMHVEEAAEELDLENVTGIDRERRILAEVGDWNQLKQGIRRHKENVMRERFRRLWMPALATGMVAYTAQSLAGRFLSSRAFVINGTYYSYFWQWYLVLMVTGAMGAYWSRQAGGSRRERIAVALAPSVVMAVVMLSVMPIEIIISAVVNHGTAYVNVVRHPILFLSGLISWVIFPAIPSLLGAIAFLHPAETPTQTSAIV